MLGVHIKKKTDYIKIGKQEKDMMELLKKWTIKANGEQSEWREIGRGVGKERMRDERDGNNEWWDG